jgi:geranylgeranyl pyrophosphate synthase
METRRYDNLKVPVKIRKETEKVIAKFASFGLEEFINNELAEPSKYLLNKPGKLLRPTLVFLGADYIGIEDLGLYVDLAASIELLHTSSLIHDDIIDKDISRRGIEATHLKYGIADAILGGDALISKAIQEANRYGTDVVDSISKAAMKMCAGEIIDHSYQRSQVVPTLKDYLKVAELKSSTLVGVSTSVAAVHRSNAKAARLNEFGVSLGTAFQIRDDMIDFVSMNGDRNEEDGFPYKLNIVRCIKENEGVDLESALLKASSLNRKYVRKAISKLGDSKNALLLREYASKVEIDSGEEFALNKS